MKPISALNFCLCQMNVVPGRPDLNKEYIIREIKAAAKRGVDIIAFPEMCVPGYLIGDRFEDESFVADIARANQEIIEAAPAGITAIFGTVVIAPGKTGEDGRQRLHNAAIVASNGELIKWEPKTLQPNYRFFNDGKHLFPKRGIMEEAALMHEGNLLAREHFSPLQVKTSIGTVQIGVMLCEDMWHEDYALNPALMLAQNGADILVNISASPWTWQKNRKRHGVVKELLRQCKVPLFYVNNTGAQNVGKNIVEFDGSSTAYNDRGDIIFEVPPYAEGGHDFMYKDDAPIARQVSRTDTEELYAAMVCATKSATPANAPIVIGLSGGIDSSTVAAHMVDVFGKDRVIGVSMPFIPNAKTEGFAKQVAENLGITCTIRPIENIVKAVCAASGVKPDTLAYENVQARSRMEILAAIAQQYSGVFTCNANKVEVAFGYGTLYGDLAGYYAPLIDLTKREVRQIADHLNRKRFGKEVIPQGCIDQMPTAGLAKGQHDPFDYGDLHRRGYHDEMVRAITEFRKNAEWFLDCYLKRTLEQEMQLDEGTLARLFPAPQDFIADLERWWTKFFETYYKRHRGADSPVFSKRAFGRDLEESMLSVHFTQRYCELKATI